MILSSEMQDKLKYLYPNTYEDVSKRLEERLEQFTKDYKHAHQKEELFTEKDAVLICYPDHVNEPNVMPLVSLRQFLKKYASGLVNAVHILPFYPYSSDDGFSVIDYHDVDPAFGTWADVFALSHDFKLMFDAVINHISSQSNWFKEFLKGNKKYKNYFIAFDKPVDVSSVFRPRTHPLLTQFKTEEGEKYVWTTFSADQIDLNFTDSDVFLDIMDVFLFYLEQGAKIIRLDAIAFSWKELETSSVHRPQVHALIQLYSEILHTVSPNLWVITETNVAHVDNISYFGDGHNEANLVYNFTLPPMLLYTFVHKNSDKLNEWAKTLSTPSHQTTFFNFTASHDGIGVTGIKDLISRKELQGIEDYVLAQHGRIGYRTKPGEPPFPYELNIVYYNAIGNLKAYLVSQAIMLALQGVPGIYFSNLFGATNWEEGVEKLGHNRAINRQKFGFHELEAGLNDPSSLHQKIYTAYAHLLKTRSNEPLFSPYVSQEIIPLNSQVFAILRSSGTQRLLAINNISDQEVCVSQSTLMNTLEQHDAVDILTGEKTHLTAEQDFVLSPYTTVWLKTV